MRAIVVYESVWGNTERIAREVAAVLESSIGVDLVTSDEAPLTVEDYDLVVVGGPTHAFSMSRPGTRETAAKQHGATHVPTRGIREWIGALEAPSSSRVVVTFDTRVDSPRLPGSAAKAARHDLRSHGFSTDAKPMSFHVHGYEGPLIDGEPERAAEWARQILAQIGVAPVAGR